MPDYPFYIPITDIAGLILFGLIVIAIVISVLITRITNH